MAERLSPYYDILFREKNSFNAHEFIIDIRPIKKEYDINEEDVAKRLMDYGFHAPTLSWPVSNTMMVEPTESESLDELKRFVKAMEMIRIEIFTNKDILKNAPHTARMIAGAWDFNYSREQASFPVNQKNKFWPAVSRIDNVYGDRNLVCSCTVEVTA